jgi:hypothetical protein
MMELDCMDSNGKVGLEEFIFKLQQISPDPSRAWPPDEAAAAAAAAGGRAVDGLQDGRQACARRPAEGLAWSQRLAAERSRAERARLALTEQVRTHCR